MEKLAAEQRKETKRQFINAKYKDSVFRMAFEEKKYQLELYNALNGSDYDDPEAVDDSIVDDSSSDESMDMTDGSSDSGEILDDNLMPVEENTEEAQ